MQEGAESLDKTLEAIIENPQKSFVKFLFESDVLATIHLLNELIVYPNGGHSYVIQCLWCWQDLMESPHSLSPIVDELRQTDSVDVAISALKLIVQILKLAPNPISRIRTRHELKLNINELVSRLKLKFNGNFELNKLIVEWMRTSVEPNIERANLRPADTDSGTFSGEEEEEMAVVNESITVLDQDSFTEIINEINEEPLNKVSQEICAIFLEILKEIRNQLSKNENSSIEKIIEQFRPQTKSEQQDKKLLIPAPPPPPISPPPPSFLKKPPAPPPPISINIKKPASSGSKANKNFDIPMSLKPKVFPPEGQKMRHLQWTKIPLNVLSATTSAATLPSASSANVWQKMDIVDEALKDRLDFTELDKYFCCNSEQGCSTNSGISNSTNANGNSAQTIPPKAVVISLISGKRSLSVNLFLKMCKDVQNLVENLNIGNSEAIGLERLKMLLQLIPNEEEVKVLE